MIYSQYVVTILLQDFRELQAHDDEETRQRAILPGTAGQQGRKTMIKHAAIPRDCSETSIHHRITSNTRGESRNIQQYTAVAAVGGLPPFPLRSVGPSCELVIYYLWVGWGEFDWVGLVWVMVLFAIV